MWVFFFFFGYPTSSVYLYYKILHPNDYFPLHSTPPSLLSFFRPRSGGTRALSGRVHVPRCVFTWATGPRCCLDSPETLEVRTSSHSINKHNRYETQKWGKRKNSTLCSGYRVKAFFFSSTVSFVFDLANATRFARQLRFAVAEHKLANDPLAHDVAFEYFIGRWKHGQWKLDRNTGSINIFLRRVAKLHRKTLHMDKITL